MCHVLNAYEKIVLIILYSNHCRIDSAAALIVLGEAAKFSLPTLAKLQAIACGVIPADIVTDNVDDQSEYQASKHLHPGKW